MSSQSSDPDGGLTPTQQFYQSRPYLSLRAALNETPDDTVEAALNFIYLGWVTQDPPAPLPAWWHRYAATGAVGREAVRQARYALGVEATAARKAPRWDLANDMRLRAGTETRSIPRPLVIWGDDTRWYHTGDRHAIIFGQQAAGKTTAAGNLAAGRLGAPGFDVLLGHAVEPLPPDEGVLILQHDGPTQAGASLDRLTLPDGTSLRAWAGKRLVTYSGVPDGFGHRSEPDVVPAFVTAVEEYHGLRFGHVFVDNGQGAWGNITAPDRAQVAYDACLALSSAGRSVTVLTQDKKGTGALNDEDQAYAAQALLMGAGAILSLQRLRHGRSILRHLKGGEVDRHERIGVILDISSGRMTLAPEAPGRASDGDYLRALADAAKPLTTREVVEAVGEPFTDATKKRALRGLKRLAVEETVSCTTTGRDYLWSVA